VHGLTDYEYGGNLQPNTPLYFAAFGVRLSAYAVRSHSRLVGSSRYAPTDVLFAGGLTVWSIYALMRLNCVAPILKFKTLWYTIAKARRLSQGRGSQSLAALQLNTGVLVGMEHGILL
jgi:hypothetical protein